MKLQTQDELELVNRVAREVMGWHRGALAIWRDKDENPMMGGQCRMCDADCCCNICTQSWNPIHNMNHTKMVVDRLLHKPFYRVNIDYGRRIERVVNGIVHWAPDMIFGVDVLQSESFRMKTSTLLARAFHAIPGRAVCDVAFLCYSNPDYIKP